MGDASDMNDLDRFTRSPEGKAHLAGIRQVLLGRTVKEVTFTNEGHHLAVTLHLDNGQTFVATQPSLEVGAIRDRFQEVLEREYYRDFPESSE